MNLSRIKKYNKISSKGFTLIELLIVIAILGILAAALLVALNPGQRIAASRNARVRSDLVNLGNKANIVNADSGLITTCASGGSYPNSLTQTVCTIPYNTTAPLPPTGTYTYSAVTASGGACDGNVAGTACARISISGPAYTDGVVDATANTTWCWRSASGTITQVAGAVACTP